MSKVTRIEIEIGTCPYEGLRTRAVTPPVDDAQWVEQLRCGQHGWLCHRCREDRADARVAQIAGWLRKLYRGP